MLRSRAINEMASSRGRWATMLTVLHALRVPKSVVARLG
jgi:hypothetical protein